MYANDIAVWHRMPELKQAQAGASATFRLQDAGLIRSQVTMAETNFLFPEIISCIS